MGKLSPSKRTLWPTGTRRGYAAPHPADAGLAKRLQARRPASKGGDDLLAVSELLRLAGEMRSS